jgi:hypothetical protein
MGELEGGGAGDDGAETAKLMEGFDAREGVAVGWRRGGALSEGSFLKLLMLELLSSFFLVGEGSFAE